MKSAGVNIDSVIESVLAQKCDALAGWWTLLLEKEQRKMLRRELKRQERDAENKSLRRISAASSRLERMAPLLQDVDEDGGLTSQFIKSGLAHSRSRGRSERRSAHYYAGFNAQDLPQLSEAGREEYSQGHASADDVPPTPIDKDSIRSVSTSRHRRPLPPPKEGIIRSARSRGSTLHLVTTSEALGGGGSVDSEPQNGEAPKAKRKPSKAIIAHWKNWTHWIFENTTKRRRWHEKKTSRSTPDLHDKEGTASSGTGKDSKDATPRPQTSKYPGSSGSPRAQATAGLPKGVVANGHLTKAQSNQGQQQQLPGGATVVHQTRSGSSRGASSAHAYAGHHAPGRISTSQSYKRQSLSPSPLTPRSGMRRSSAGLRGRKSTSSSVSSVRSMHRHHHSHSKASSTSSAGSVSTSKTPHHRGVSPHHSVKVLPATPTTTSFPSNIRLVRAMPAPLSIYNEGMPANQDAPPGSPNPFASGIMFAKRKKNLFKGPTLNFGGPGGHHGAAGGGSRNHHHGGHSRSGSGSALGRRSGEITIQEEDEDYSEQMDGATDTEEVETFAPIMARPGEIITEQIIEDSEPTPTLQEDRLRTPVTPGFVDKSVEASPSTVKTEIQPGANAEPTTKQ